MAARGMVLRLALTALTLVLGGCSHDSTAPAGADLQALQESRARWDATGITSYEYRFRRSCFCVEEDTREVWVTVTDDQITGVRYADTGLPVPADRHDRYETVDGLFEIAADALARPADSFEASYDPSLGYPLHIAIDYSRNIADEEMAFDTRDLQ